MEALRLFRWLLDGLGLLALALILSFVVMTYFSSREDQETATKPETTFVLRLAGLDPHQDYHVVSSYRSASSPLTGDGTTRHCIELQSFEPDPQTSSAWVFGAEANAQMRSARDLAADAHASFDACFGPVDRASNDLGFLLSYVRFYEGEASDVEALFYYRPLRRLLFVSVAT